MVAKSEIRLKNAMLELVQKKKFSAISVKMLCSKSRK